MSYRLRMSDEIRTWLTDLRAEDLDAATVVGQALTELIDEGANLGPPLVGPLAGDLEPDELIEALDGACELKLERMQDERRRMAAIAPDELTRSQLAAHEALQAETDAFRIRKEVLRARSVAAEAHLAIDQTDADAANQLAEVTAQMRRELPGAEGLMELRPGAPHGDVLIFFAAEPAGAALLITVLEGAKAIRRSLVQAMAVSADVLRHVRAGQDPGASEWEFADKRAFLAEFFPDSVREDS